MIITVASSFDANEARLTQRLTQSSVDLFASLVCEPAAMITAVKREPTSIELPFATAQEADISLFKR